MRKIICIFLIFFVSCVSIKEYKRLQNDTEIAKSDCVMHSVEMQRISVEIKILQSKIDALEVLKAKKDSINEAIRKNFRRK